MTSDAQKALEWFERAFALISWYEPSDFHAKTIRTALQNAERVEKLVKALEASEFSHLTDEEEIKKAYDIFIILKNEALAAYRDDK